jgi:hypothetical protein
MLQEELKTELIVRKKKQKPIGLSKEEKTLFKEFKKDMRKFIMTTRFGKNRYSPDTWRENQDYLEKVKSNKIQCIYSASSSMTCKIPVDSILFVLEMNNLENRIMGIGLIKNHPTFEQHPIYTDGNYNRVVYLGKHHITREEMDETEEGLFQWLDLFCFTGAKHLKRGRGFTCFPLITLFKCHKEMDIVEFISSMFRKRIQGKA